MEGATKLQPSEMFAMSSPRFLIDVSLPLPPDPTDAFAVASFWRDTSAMAKQIVRAQFFDAFHQLRSTGVLKEYKELDRFCWTIHQDRQYGGEIRTSHLGLLELAKPGWSLLACLSFKLVFPKDVQLSFPEPQEFRKLERATFLHLNEPWEALLISGGMKLLKRQLNMTFGIHVGICLPLVSEDRVPSPECCQHDFRLLPLTLYEWRLIWECKHCGYLCHCSCFSRAIQAEPFPSHWVNQEVKPGRKISSIGYRDSVCEMCRGIPATDPFCHPMYGRSEFESRYGAYILKRMAEMRADGIQVPYFPLFDATASNYVREQVGCYRIGERWADETALYRVVQSLFPQKEVVHHYRAKWLGRQELDIFVPDLKVAIEFHGEQHFEPVSAWGGEEALDRTRARDSRKVELCERAGVKLVVFTFRDELTPETVAQRLQREGVPVPSIES